MNILDNLHLAAPCPAKWDDMEGDDKVRHCGLCALNVYNLQAMTEAEAQDFISSKNENGERICALLYRRADGKVLTKDCPRGLSLLRDKSKQVWQKVCAAASLLVGSISLGAFGTTPAARAGDCVELKDGRSIPMPGKMMVIMPWTMRSDSSEGQKKVITKINALPREKYSTEARAKLYIELGKVYKAESEEAGNAKDENKLRSLRGHSLVCFNSAATIAGEIGNKKLQEEASKLGAELKVK